MEQKYPHGANIPWTAPHHKNFSSDRENSSGDRDSCDPDFIYRSHIRIRVPLHIMPAFFTVEIIQLTGRPPCEYPIRTVPSAVCPPTGRSPYKYPIHTPRCLQTAQHDMPSTPPATCACTGPLSYKPAGRIGQRVTLCPSSLQREQRCT